jgi:hypothetical protein
MTIFGKGSTSLEFYIKTTGKIAISKNGTAEIVESTVALTAGLGSRCLYEVGQHGSLYINGRTSPARSRIKRLPPPRRHFQLHRRQAGSLDRFAVWPSTPQNFRQHAFGAL